MNFFDFLSQESLAEKVGVREIYNPYGDNDKDRTSLFSQLREAFKDEQQKVKALLAIKDEESKGDLRLDWSSLIDDCLLQMSDPEILYYLSAEPDVKAWTVMVARVKNCEKDFQDKAENILEKTIEWTIENEEVDLFEGLSVILERF